MPLSRRTWRRLDRLSYDASPVVLSERILQPVYLDPRKPNARKSHERSLTTHTTRFKVRDAT